MTVKAICCNNFGVASIKLRPTNYGMTTFKQQLLSE